jgi:hypothetical protein
MMTVMMMMITMLMMVVGMMMKLVVGRRRRRMMMMMMMMMVLSVVAGGPGPVQEGQLAARRAARPRTAHGGAPVMMIMIMIMMKGFSCIWHQVILCLLPARGNTSYQTWSVLDRSAGQEDQGAQKLSGFQDPYLGSQWH